MNIVNKLEDSVTVGELIRYLGRYDEDARVVFVSPYGDRGNTQEVHLVERVDEYPATTLYGSGYSNSGVAFDEDNEEDELDESDHELPQMKILVLQSN